MTDLPEGIDGAYPDRGDGDKAHQQHHDALHAETHNALQAIPDGQVAGKVGGQVVGVAAGEPAGAVADHEDAADPHGQYLTDASGVSHDGTLQVGAIVRVKALGPPVVLEHSADPAGGDTAKLDMVANTRDIVGYERGFARDGVTDAMVGTPLEGTAAVWDRAAGTLGNWSRNVTPNPGTPGWWGADTNGTQALVWNAGSAFARQSVVVTNLGSAIVHLLAAYVDANNYAYCYLNRAALRIGYVAGGVDNIVQSFIPTNLSFQGAKAIPLSFWIWPDGSNLHMIAEITGKGLEGRAAVAGSINGTRYGVMQSFSGVKFRDYYLQVG